MTKSLEEVYKTININQKNTLRKTFSFFGPAFLVSVGYMDPGNWATDIAGGSQYGYVLIWVLLMSNIMALILQSLSARLGLVTGLDLAQASRETYPKTINFSLYILAELAIASCDLAEVLGMAIGMNLLFKIPLLIGVLITFFDTFLLLFLINKGMRKMEAFILTLIFIIGACFLIEMFFAKPQFSELIKGFVPSLPDHSALFIAIGIIGATVMPHNLYLHSSLVQTRKYGSDTKSKKQAIKYNLIDSAVALNIAFFVNMAILVLAASTFFKTGMMNVVDIQDAHRFLEPLLGNKFAPILFAVALIAAGQSSTLTGTLAGQIVMEGYINLRIQPWVRRILTRALAIVPAVIVIVSVGDQSVSNLMVISQVLLSLQLGFAVIPLIHFVSDKGRMGKFAIKSVMKSISWAIAIVIIVLNAKFVFDGISDILNSSSNSIYIWFSAVPAAIAAGLLLFYITIFPLYKRERKVFHSTHQAQPYHLQLQLPYHRIAIAVDLSIIDSKIINSALSIGSIEADYLLIHIEESAGARLWGKDTSDQESLYDPEQLNEIIDNLNKLGYKIKTIIDYGNPKKLIPKIVQDFGADLLVLGAHGHKGISDLIFGSVLGVIRHKLKIPLFIVKE